MPDSVQGSAITARLTPPAHSHIAIGRIVHFVLPRQNPDTEKPVIRPAIVVHVWSQSAVQLQVFYDGTNDNRYRFPHGAPPVGISTDIGWATSVCYDGGETRRGDDGTDYEHYNPYTWHWPPRG